jgi:hypothetical protein
MEIRAPDSTGTYRIFNGIGPKVGRVGRPGERVARFLRDMPCLNVVHDDEAGTEVACERSRQHAGTTGAIRVVRGMQMVRIGYTESVP